MNFSVLGRAGFGQREEEARIIAPTVYLKELPQIRKDVPLPSSSDADSESSLN